MNEMPYIVWILVIYTAILLLIRFYVYPYLKKVSRKRISVSIQIHPLKKEKDENVSERKKTDAKPELKQDEKQEKTASVLGKSKYVLRQPLPNTATNLETENRTEKEDTFAPATEKLADEQSAVNDQNAADEKVDYETGEGLDIQKDDEADEGRADVPENPPVDLDEEAQEVETGVETGSELASGVDYFELGETARTIENADAGNNEEKVAGKVLSENTNTQLVESIRQARPEYAKRISDLIDLHERELAKVQNNEIELSRKQMELYESEDFINFDVNEIS